MQCITKTGETIHNTQTLPSHSPSQSSINIDPSSGGHKHSFYGEHLGHKYLIIFTIYVILIVIEERIAEVA